MAVFVPHIIYFWITVVGLCIAPFLFNPHQFSFTDFIIDYREFLRWMSRGNSRTHANSWVGYCRLSRTRITGFKRKRLGLPSEKVSAVESVSQQSRRARATRGEASALYSSGDDRIPAGQGADEFALRAGISDRHTPYQCVHD